MKLSACFLLLAIATCAAQSDPARGRQPIVLITSNVTVSNHGAAFFGFFGGSSSNHDETPELARDLLKMCPEVSLTINTESRDIDYALLLNHDDLNQLLLLRADKSVVFATEKNRLSKVVRKSCKAIMTDWRDHKPEATPASTAPAAASSAPANARGNVPASVKDHDKQWWQATNPPPK